MFAKFIKENIRAIRTSLFFLSIILTSLVFIIFGIGYFYDSKLPDLRLCLIIFFSAGIGFPFFLTTIGFLKWWRDYFFTNKIFNSVPFDKLHDIGFEKIIKNKNSKFHFTSEYFVGNISGFIVDFQVESNRYEDSLIFAFNFRHKQIDNADIKRIQKIFTEQNGFIYADCIIKKYHYKKHNLNSIWELESDLKNFAQLIKIEKL